MEETMAPYQVLERERERARERSFTTEHAATATAALCGWAIVLAIASALLLLASW
jgi:hypothetical protein